MENFVLAIVRSNPTSFEAAGKGRIKTKIMDIKIVDGTFL
jgi:hypothetical protein